MTANRRPRSLLYFKREIGRRIEHPNCITGGIAWENIEEICLNNFVENSFLTEIQKYALKCRLQKFEIPQALKLVSEVWTPDMVLFIMTSFISSYMIICFK